MKLRCRDLVLDLSNAAVMGVLNVTPDSFSDGGLWSDADAAIAHARDMVAQGASIIDVGGESTRPGADAVSVSEELNRVLPVIKGLRSTIDVPVSIDTRKPVVARRALEAGASIINDTAGEVVDRAMDQVAAEMGAAIIVMHSRGTPGSMQDQTDYADVVRDVIAFLGGRSKELQRMGVPSDAICLDPGIGFAKSTGQNLELLRRLDELSALGHPLLIGTSRKSFIGKILDVPVDERIEGTIATVVWAIAKGARVIRVHDVGPVVRAVRMTEAICSGSAGAGA